MSLDGYIATTDGQVDWLIGDGSDEQHLGTFDAFYEKVDTILMGYKTFYQITHELSPNNWAYEGKKTYVMSHHKRPDTKDICFTDRNLLELLTDLKRQEGQAIWALGGADLINQDLIDYYCITMIPTLLGDGIALFDKHVGKRLLKLVSVQHYNGMTDLLYAIKR